MTQTRGLRPLRLDPGGVCGASGARVPRTRHGFVGMSREEAWPLIEELADHAMQERFVYYHRWRGGDYRPEERRIMLRTIVYANGGRTRRAISG